MLSDQNQKPIVLEVEGLRVYYETPAGDVLAVNGIDFQLYQGEVRWVWLVSPVAVNRQRPWGFLQLVVPPGRIVSGQVLLDGQNLLDLSARELRKLRWAKLSLIPQGAMNSLNPTMKINHQIQDVIDAHLGRTSKQEIRDRILELLQMVGLPETCLSYVSASTQWWYETACVHRYGHCS